MSYHSVRVIKINIFCMFPSSNRVGTCPTFLFQIHSNSNGYYLLFIIIIFRENKKILKSLCLIVLYIFII